LLGFGQARTSSDLVVPFAGRRATAALYCIPAPQLVARDVSGLKATHCARAERTLLK